MTNTLGRRFAKFLTLCLVFMAMACSKDDVPTTPTPTPTPTPIVTKSSAKDITKFSFAALSPVIDGTIDATAKTISATVGIETVEKLVPTFTVSDKATVSPAMGVAQDFSKEVSYTVTAEDGSTQIWKVSVKIDALVAKVCRLQTIDMGSNGTDFYVYDDKKRLTKIEAKDTKGSLLRTQSYEYNTDGTLKSYSYSFSNYSEKTSYSYQNGRRIGETTNYGTFVNTSKFEYDSNGNLIKRVINNDTYNYSNGITTSISDIYGTTFTLNEMGFVTKLVGSDGHIDTYEYDKDGQVIKSESFDDKGTRYYYRTIEYSTTKLNDISYPNPQVNSKGGLLIIPSYGNNIYYSKRNTTYNIKNGVETKASDIVFDTKLDSKGKILSTTTTNNLFNITTTRTYNYQECE
jgi:Domain of unknown function (DUF5018)